MKTVLLSLVLLCPLLSWAQIYKISTDDTGRRNSWLLMRDGTVLRGQVLRQDSTIISVRQRGGDMSFVEADQVVRITGQRPDEFTSGINSPEGITSIGADGTPRTGKPQTVFVMRDGARVPGTFIKRDSTMITVRKPNGLLTFFEPELLSRVDTVYGGATGTGIVANQFSPWLLTGLTAFNLQKGRFYYRNTWLLLNEFDYGITSFWSVGGRFVVPFPFPSPNNDDDYAVQYRTVQPQLVTKISGRIGAGFQLGAQVAYQRGQRTNYFGNDNGLWTLQALASIGSSQHNVTFGYRLVLPGQRMVTYTVPQPLYSSTLPYIYTYYIPNRQYLSLGIMQKVGRNLTLLSDNTLSLDNQTAWASQRATVSLALRLDRPRHAFDLGLYSLLNDNESRSPGDPLVRLYPYVGYNLLIGK